MLRSPDGDNKGGAPDGARLPSANALDARPLGGGGSPLTSAARRPRRPTRVGRNGRPVWLEGLEDGDAWHAALVQIGPPQRARCPGLG